ncbi:MAG: hypothetical protein ACRCTZ_10825 [Sarcina sp.]
MNIKFMFKKSINYLIFIIFISSVIFLLKFINMSFVNNIPTMSIPKDSKVIKHDLNGDSIKDLIYILVKNDKYQIEISMNEKTYFLNEKRPLNSLGRYGSLAPLELSFFDISRNNLSEIFLQSFDDNSPIQHIYTFDNNEFKDIFCSTNNTLGILNSKNTQSPKYYSLNLNNIDESLQKYMLINSTPKNISYDESKIPGISTIQLIIDFITTDTPLGDVFFENTPSSIYKTLESINKVENTYTLLDCFFIDTEWDSNGDISKLDWRIRIKEKNIENLNSSVLKLNISLKKIENKFLISHVTIEKDH